MARKKQKLTAFDTHEALHTAWMCMDSVDRYLCEHPVVMAHKKVGRLCQKASQALFDAYQELGRISIEETESK